MIRNQSHVAALLPLLLAAAPAAAQDAGDTAALFTAWDSNRDGIVTRAEFPGSDEQWRGIDQNRDGRATPQEVAASAFARQLAIAAAREREAPRPRLPQSPALEARIAAAIAACDQNRDGRVSRAEWTGAPLAFDALDRDGDGSIGTGDLRAPRVPAAAATGGGTTSPPAAPEPTSELPSSDALLRRLDMDRDQQLTAAEIGSHRLAAWLPFGDRNRDGKLDKGELDAIVGHVAARVRARNEGSARRRAFVVPFSGWDRDGDGRLAYDEFVEQRHLFAAIDADRDGFVTPLEWERWRRAVEGDGFVSRFDLNGDGRVTPEEFGGAAAAFRRADRNGDGVVDRADG